MKIKIDIVAPPFSGHLYPLIELTKPLLNNNNFEVRFITGFQKIPLLTELGFNAVPLLPEYPEIMESIANTPKPVRNNPFNLFKQLKHHLSIIPKLKSELEILFKENNTNIVIADFVAIPAGIICEENKIPWITVIASPFAIETLSGTPSYFGGLSYSESFKVKIRDYIARKIVRSFKNIVGFLCKNEFKRLNYKVYRIDGSENAYSPYSILGLGMEEFEFKRDWPKSFKFVGPCCCSPEPVLDLDIPFKHYKNTILISIGTHLEWAKSKLIDETTILANNFQDTLFVISFGKPEKRSNNPVYKDKNILTYEYIPYSQYFEKFDAVIHHGGAGITYNCIKYQKPCLVIPHDYDQFDFAARIEYNKIGIRVKNVYSKQTILDLHNILSDKRFIYLNELNKHMQKYSPSLELEKEIFRLTEKTPISRI